ncbi:hypothetical protein Sbs19_27340 [Sphingobium sp. BS19]|nr:hypothetical protein Sbs19_27340 [Sphingobium sp. BS19]
MPTGTVSPRACTETAGAALAMRTSTGISVGAQADSATLATAIAIIDPRNRRSVAAVITMPPNIVEAVRDAGLFHNDDDFASMPMKYVINWK